MPRVLVYVPTLYRLGLAAALLGELPLLVRHGIDVHIATSEIPDQENLAAGIPVPVHRCKTCPGDRMWQFSLRKTARDLRADVLHNWCGPSGVDWAWMGIRGRRVATVNNVHQIASLLNRKSGKPERIVLQDENANPEMSGAFRVGATTVPWIRTRAKVLESTTHDQKDRDYFQSRFGIPSGSIVAVAAATLEPESRLKDLIWATDLLGCVRDDVHLIIAGSGRQKEKLRRFSRLTDSASHVHFHGLPADPVAMIRSADLFWQSSPEGSGRYAMMTAMSAGIPVIAAAERNFQDLVLHQQTGLLVPPGSRDGFARWSGYLTDLPAQKQQLVRQAASFVQDQHSNTSGLDQLVDWYNG